MTYCMGSRIVVFSESIRLLIPGPPLPFLCMHACIIRFNRVQLFGTLWTVTCQAPLSMGFSRQEYWSGLPCPPPGDLPNSGTAPASLMSPALADGLFTSSATWGAHKKIEKKLKMKPNSTILYIVETSRGKHSWGEAFIGEVTGLLYAKKVYKGFFLLKGLSDGTLSPTDRVNIRPYYSVICWCCWFKT